MHSSENEEESVRLPQFKLQGKQRQMKHNIAAEESDKKLTY